MAVSTVYVGRAPGSSVTDLGVIAEDQLRVCVFNRISQHLWLSRIGARLGVNSGANIQYRLVAYRGTPDHIPDSRLAYVGLHTTNTAMVNAAGGADVEWPVDVVDVGPSQLAAQLFTNIYVGLGIEQDTAGALGHGMIAAANIVADEERFFNKFAVDIPPDPFGSYTSSNEGHLAIWGVCHTNEEPRVPIGRTTNQASGDLTPTLEADFRDRNGAWGVGNDGFNDGDKVKRVQYQLRRVSDAVIFWDSTYSATASEQTNNRSVRVYAGTTLVRGTAYEWRVRHQDQFDAWGDWADWFAYTPPSNGTVTLAGTPTGKQETDQPGPFQFTWNHATALSTNAVEIRLKQSGTIVRTSPTITKTVANTATGSITWAETTWAALSWGPTYSYEVRGRDTNNNWSNWSSGRTFNTDAAPTVPAGFSPSGGTVFTSFPLLQVDWTDSDDTTLTGLTGTFEITRPNATVINVTPTFNATSGEWEYQTTATELDQFGTYKWRARSFDGTLYSGVTTVAGSATWGGPVTFQYLAGPSVSISSPADNATVTTSTPTVTWVAATQTQYRLQLVNPTTGIAVYDSGWVVSTAQSAAIAAGYWHNLEARDITVSVKDAASLEGSDTNTNITLSYTAPPDITGLNVFGVEIGSDLNPSAIRGEWDATTEPVGTFVAYLVYRSDIVDGPIIRITSPSQTVFQDFFPASGVQYNYTVRVLALRDNVSEVESAGVTSSAMIQLGGVVLASIANPTGLRCVLTSVQERSHELHGIEMVYQTWGAITDANTAPTTIRGKGRWWEIQGLYLIREDDAAPATQRRAEARACGEVGGTFCYRDELGTVEFVTIPVDGGMLFTDRRFARADLQLRLRRENFRLSLPLEIS